MSIPFTLIAGPCVLESPELVFDMAAELKAISKRLGIRLLFKTSFDKANRSSGGSFRGPGLEQGLAVLAQLKQELGVQLLTDIHESHQAAAVGQVVDVLQIPAFLCRQTDLLVAAAAAVQNPAAAASVVNVKKGQFLAPWDMAQVVSKLREAGLQGSDQLWLTERGTSFGYNTLVVDMRSLPQLRQLGCPVIFDATHSVQQPGGRGSSTGGQREFGRRWHGQPWRLESMGCSLRPTPTPIKPSAMGPTWCRFSAWSLCWSSCWRFAQQPQRSQKR